VLTHLLLDDLKKSAAAEDGDARVVVVTSGLHDIEISKKRGRMLALIVTTCTCKVSIVSSGDVPVLNFKDPKFT